MLGPPFPVVHNRLLCLDHVEGEDVVLAPHGQVSDLLLITIVAVLPFIVCNNLQSLPHPSSVAAGVVQFDFSPVLKLCLFDGSSEGVARFLIS